MPPLCPACVSCCRYGWSWHGAHFTAKQSKRSPFIDCHCSSFFLLYFPIPFPCLPTPFFFPFPEKKTIIDSGKKGKGKATDREFLSVSNSGSLSHTHTLTTLSPPKRNSDSQCWGWRSIGGLGWLVSCQFLLVFKLSGRERFALFPLLPSLPAPLSMRLLIPWGCQRVDTRTGRSTGGRFRIVWVILGPSRLMKVVEKKAELCKKSVWWRCRLFLLVPNSGSESARMVFCRVVEPLLYKRLPSCAGCW